MSSAIAALLGSFATALAILGGGVAVEAYRHRRARAGMALALAGAMDALLHLIEARRIGDKLTALLPRLEAGEDVRIGHLVGDVVPFQTITNAYSDQLGTLGGDLPFRVARFLVSGYSVHLDLLRLSDNLDNAATKAQLIRDIAELWGETSRSGITLIEQLRRTAGSGRAARPMVGQAGFEPTTPSPPD